MGKVYDKLVMYNRKYPGGLAWRIKKHADIIERHLNPGEEILYAFAGQKNDRWYNIVQSAAVVLTNKRILIGSKRVLYGYFLTSVTPDLFNDLDVYQGMFWGKVTIDTIKEVIIITNVPKASLPEIETNITEFMMKEKKKYRMDSIDEEKNI